MEMYSEKRVVCSLFPKAIFFSLSFSFGSKYISEDTQKIPQSRSTAFPRTKRRRDKEQIMTIQTPHMKTQKAATETVLKPFQPCRLNKVTMQTITMQKGRSRLDSCHLIRIYTVCHSVLIFLSSVKMDISKFNNEKVHFINSGMKGLNQFTATHIK